MEIKGSSQNLQQLIVISHYAEPDACAEVFHELSITKDCPTRRCD